jgi:Aerobic-type carbon monoxide dehydrogenase, middle subunit CoxM/CutM homologs
MKPAPFEYHRPSSLAEALELLADLPEAEPMAGNQSLSILMSNRLASPDHLVDINDLDELSYVQADDKSVEVGALVRHREIEESGRLTEAMPLFPEAAGKIAGPVVRNRGTVGGSLGEGDPAGNYPCVAAALDVDLELASVDGSRTVSSEDFFIATMFTDIREEELITGITIPREPFPPARTGQTFLAVKEAAQTWPTLSAASAVRVDDPEADEPVVEEARVALSNAAEIPLRISEGEDELAGEPLSEAALDAAGETAYEAVNPEEELHADETYKRELAREYTKRALRTAHERAVA